MIYFVDEDELDILDIVEEFRDNGHSVTQLTTADEAFRKLQNADDIEFLIIDLMLATDINSKMFDAIETDNFTKTGLVLFDKLIAAWGGEESEKSLEIRKKSSIFSAATDSTLVDSINAAVGNLGIRYLRKRDYDDSLDFYNDVMAKNY
jgi:hypothetical protein